LEVKKYAAKRESQRKLQQKAPEKKFALAVKVRAGGPKDRWRKKKTGSLSRRKKRNWKKPPIRKVNGNRVEQGRSPQDGEKR